MEQLPARSPEAISQKLGKIRGSDAPRAAAVVAPVVAPAPADSPPRSPPLVDSPPPAAITSRSPSSSPSPPPPRKRLRKYSEIVVPDTPPGFYVEVALDPMELETQTDILATPPP